MNFLWIDVETTGRFADKHDIVQLACIPVINGKRMPHFNEFCQPTNYETVEQGAIDVHGITIARMRTFQTQAEMLAKFVAYLKAFDAKFIISGFNVSFDKRFLSSAFTKNALENEFFSLFELQVHDTYSRAQSVKKLIGSENLKLATLAKHYKVEIDAHEALSDIAATMEVDKNIGKLLEEEEFVAEADQEEVVLTSVFKEPAQLHVHSMYGMVESVPDPEDWAAWCAKNNIPGFSVVDHGVATSLYAMTRIASQKDKNKNQMFPGVTGIPGVGLYLTFDIDREQLYPVNAWATSTKGYFNLMKLASIGFDNAVEIDGINRPRLLPEQFAPYMEGLVFGTGDVYGAVGDYIAEGDAEKAERSFNKYLELFGDKLYVEFIPVSIRISFSAKKGFQPIKRNALVTDGDLNKAYNQFLSKMVDKHNLKCVPTSGAHFIDSSDKLIQDCISRNSYKSGKCYNESYHAKTAKDLYVGLRQQLGEWLTEEKFGGWIQNTLDILEQAKSIVVKHEFHLPKIEIPDHIKAKTDDYNKQTYFLTVEKCMEHGRWNNDPVYVERFKKEIDVIMKNETLNFLPYFLMYEDIGAYARSQGILQGIGRGSAGGSLLSYYLKIIHIDPIVHNLPFERFLSHARIRAGSFPDIDADFGDRTPIITYLEKKYGLGFAQVCTFQKMKTKNAIKDAMFALYGTNREEPNLKAVCELIPDSPQGVDEADFLYGFTDKEGEYHPGVVEIYPEVQGFFKMYPAVESMVKRLIGVVRGVGRHASAYVISTIDLANERVPTMRMYDKNTDENITVTQFEAPMCEGSGLVKADILGVTTIDAVTECVRLVKENTGLDLLEEDENGVALIYRLPEDKAVYRDFYNKDTDSSFQFNTSLIKGYIQRFNPTEREHLSAMTAMCRPGTLDAPFSNDEIAIDDGVSAAQYYMDVRNGARRLSYLHPDLATCTSNGVFVYQEEVMKFLVDIAGYTLEESDQIRNAIAKKKHEVMMACFVRIREACANRGWTPEQANTVCDQIMAFSRYSFNRSHSRCYAELGYITMYLKHHFKLEWWTAILNNTKKEDKLRHYMTLLGSVVTSPSLAAPNKVFAILKDSIVAPLSVLKQVGPAAIDELVAKGPFTSLEDYVRRVQGNKVNVGHFSSIIMGRAADCLMDPNLPYIDARKKLMDDYVKLKGSRPFKEEMYKLDPITVFLMEKDINKCFNKSLLDDQAVSVTVQTKLDELEWTGKRNVPFFRGIKGKQNEKLPVVGSIRAANNMVKNNFDGEVGLILLFEGSSYKKGISKKSGKEYHMVKAQLTDGFSMLECTWWDKRSALRWEKNSIVFVRGTLSEGWGGILNLTVKEMERIE
jgi:DNA polymerase III subunit alpha